MIWASCCHCHRPCDVVTIRTNGRCFCSNACHEAAQAQARKAAKEASERTRSARLRSNLFYIALTMLGLASLAVISGQYDDERTEARERKSLYGRVTWNADSPLPLERTQP